MNERMGRRSSTTDSSSSSSSIDSSRVPYNHQLYHQQQQRRPNRSFINNNNNNNRDLSTELRLGLSLTSSTSQSRPHSYDQHDDYEPAAANSDWSPNESVVLLRRSMLAENNNHHHGQVESSSSADAAAVGGTHFFVKVYMEGIPIGRKLDLFAHHGYHELVTTLTRMFSTTILYPGIDRVHYDQDHVLTYEDKEGDLMMVGDVPWDLFLSTVKKLKITRSDMC